MRPDGTILAVLVKAPEFHGELPSNSRISRPALRRVQGAAQALIQMAEVAVSGGLSRKILSLIDDLRPRPASA